jgi:hypothetical protein
MIRKTVWAGSLSLSLIGLCTIVFGLDAMACPTRQLAVIFFGLSLGLIGYLSAKSVENILKP